MESEGNNRRDLGRLGEDLACGLLEEMGHIILERNWRSGHLEIDIISVDSKGIHFVEVKARRQSIQAPPQENVDWKKQKRIVKAAQGFMRTKRGMLYGSHECFFDVVAVTFEGDGYRREWFPEAYVPLYV